MHFAELLKNIEYLQCNRCHQILKEKAPIKEAIARVDSQLKIIPCIHESCNGFLTPIFTEGFKEKIYREYADEMKDNYFYEQLQRYGSLNDVERYQLNKTLQAKLNFSKNLIFLTFNEHQ